MKERGLPVAHELQRQRNVRFEWRVRTHVNVDEFLANRNRHGRYIDHRKLPRSYHLGMHDWLRAPTPALDRQIRSGQAVPRYSAAQIELSPKRLPRVHELRGPPRRDCCSSRRASRGTLRASWLRRRDCQRLGRPEAERSTSLQGDCPIFELESGRVVSMTNSAREVSCTGNNPNSGSPLRKTHRECACVLKKCRDIGLLPHCSHRLLIRSRAQSHLFVIFAITQDSQVPGDIRVNCIPLPS